MPLSSTEYPLIHQYIPVDLYQSFGEEEADQLEKVIKDIGELNDKLKQGKGDPGRQIKFFANTIPGAIRGYVVSSRELNLLGKPALLKCFNHLVLSDNFKLDARLLAVYLSLGLFIEQLTPKSCVDFYAQGLVKVISEWQVTLSADQQKALNKELKKAEQSKISMPLQLMRMVRPGVPDEELFLSIPSGITSQEIKTSAASVSLVEAAKKINIALEQPEEIFEVMFQYYRLCEAFLERGSHNDLSKIDEGSLNTLIFSGEFEQALQSIGINVNSRLAEHVTCIARDRVKSPQVDTSALYYLAHYYREAYKVIEKNDQGQWVINPDQLMLQIEESKANVHRGEQKGFVQVMLNTTLSALCYPGVLAQIRQGFAGNSAAEEHFFKRLHDFYLINPPRFEQIFNYTLFDSKTKKRHVDDETAKWWFDKSNFYSIVVAHPAILQVVLECNDPLVLNWMTQAAHEQQDMRWAKLVLALKKETKVSDVAVSSDAAVSSGALSIFQQEAFQFPESFLNADLSGSIASIKVAQQLQRFFEGLTPMSPALQEKKNASQSMIGRRSITGRQSVTSDSNPFEFDISSTQKSTMTEKARAFLGLLTTRYQSSLEELLNKALCDELVDARNKLKALYGAVEKSRANASLREVYIHKQLSRLALVELFVCYDDHRKASQVSGEGSVSSDSEVEKGREAMKRQLLRYLLDNFDDITEPGAGAESITFFECFIESYVKPYINQRLAGQSFDADVFKSPASVTEVFERSKRSVDKRVNPFGYWLKEVFEGNVTQKLLERISSLSVQVLSRLLLIQDCLDLSMLANDEYARGYVKTLGDLANRFGGVKNQTRKEVYENKVFAQLAIVHLWLVYHQTTKEHGREFVKKGFAEYLVLNFDEIASGQLSPNTSLRHCFVYGYVADYIKRDGVQTGYTMDELFQDNNKLKKIFENSKNKDSLKKTDPFKWWLKELFAGTLSSKMLCLMSDLPHRFTETLLRPYEADLPTDVLDIINGTNSALALASASALGENENSEFRSDASGSLLDSPMSFTGRNANSFVQTGHGIGLAKMFGFGSKK